MSGPTQEQLLEMFDYELFRYSESSIDYSRINEPCKLQEFLKDLSAEDRKKPIGFSCNCPRCLPSMKA